MEDIINTQRYTHSIYLITFYNVEQLKSTLNHQKLWANTLGNAHGKLCACTNQNFLSRAIVMGIELAPRDDCCLDSMGIPEEIFLSFLYA